MLEAGGRDINPLIHMPAGFLPMLQAGMVSWKYQTAPRFSTDAMAYLKSGAPGHDELDLKYYFLPILSGDGAKIVRQHGFTNLVILTRPESRGELKLRSADPFDQPIIDANNLAEERDRDALRRGVRIAREIFKQPAYARYRGD